MLLQEEYFRVIIFGGTASLILMTGVVFYLVVVFNKNAREKQRDGFKAILDAVEAERRSIGQNLHDDIGAILGGVKLGLNSLEPAIAKDAELMKIFQSHKDSIGAAIVGVRNASHNLSSLTLNRFGIVKAIEEKCVQINYSREWQANFEANQFNKHLDVSLSNNLYRIISELINNSLKHSQGDKIDIKLHKIDNAIKLAYSDNGIGMENTSQNYGFGLRSITTRIELIKGNYKIRTAKNKGFQIEINVD